jgi:hypothetical protein
MEGRAHEYREIQGAMSTENLVRPSEKPSRRGEARELQAKTNLMPRCSVERCGMPGICWLEQRHFCLSHFIAHCYTRLQHCKRSPFADPDSASFQSEDCFLKECTERAAELVCPLRGFDNLERARLFDIFLWASELRANRAVLRPEPVEHPRAAHGSSRT